MQTSIGSLKRLANRQKFDRNCKYTRLESVPLCLECDHYVSVKLKHKIINEQMYANFVRLTRGFYDLSG